MDCFLNIPTYIRKKKYFFKIISAMFRLFTNLPRADLNKKCKKVYVTRMVTR